MDKITQLIKDITINRRKAQPIDQAIKTHNDLMDELKKALAEKRERLVKKAFNDLPPEGLFNHIEAIRYAVKSKNPKWIKAAARGAYEAGHYSALELPSLVDPDIAALYEFERTYGPAADPNQVLFFNFATAAPKEVKPIPGLEKVDLWL